MKKIIGKITGNEYELKDEPFASGGTAKIHRASIGTDQFVIKIPNNKKADDPDCKNRIKNEIFTFNKHPGLVDYYIEDALWDEADSVPCFVMKDITEDNGEFLNDLSSATFDLE